MNRTFSIQDPAWQDTTWQRDYVAALAELTEPARVARQLSLPINPFSVPVINRPADPDNRSDMLARIRITKTVQPGIRDVLLDGAKVGRIAACPWGPGWFASCTRSRLYSSMDDAALALVEAQS